MIPIIGWRRRLPKGGNCRLQPWALGLGLGLWLMGVIITVGAAHPHWNTGISHVSIQEELNWTEKRKKTMVRRMARDERRSCFLPLAPTKRHRHTFDDNENDKNKRFLRDNQCQYRTRMEFFAKKQQNHIVQKEENGKERVYIRFSRGFQRHVAYTLSPPRPLSQQQQRQQQQQLGQPCPQEWRHNDVVLQSYDFLDEAMRDYSEATLVPLPFGDGGRFQSHKNDNDDDDFEAMLAGMGTTPSSVLLTTLPDTQSSSSNDSSKVLDYLASLSAAEAPFRTAKERQDRHHRRVRNLTHTISHKRLECATLSTVKRNYHRVLDLFTRGRVRGRGRDAQDSGNEGIVTEGGGGKDSVFRVGLAMDEARARTVISEFPQLCLYDIRELEERMEFLLSPRWSLEEEEELEQTSRGRRKGGKKTGKSVSSSSKRRNLDAYTLLRNDGYGAGLTISQTTKAITAIPQFLSLYHEDARKPSLLYFYQYLRMPSEPADQAREALAPYLSGCDASDVCAFGYLRWIGVEWSSMRVILESIPTVTFCDRDPGWEMLLDQRGPVRSELVESTMHFLRKRLQVENGDIYAMMKTHSRLSAYGVKNNILPTLDAIQTRLGLSSRELRRLVLRMPSVIGMSVESTEGVVSALDKRIDFFLNEVGMNKSDLKQSILKQPSLLQYGVESSLQPKLHFLLNDLSIPPNSIPQIIRSAPAIFGLSLRQNLRPTAATLAERCDLSGEEVGRIVVRAPAVLALSLKKKIEPCLTYLTNVLGLATASELGAVIGSTPRILYQNIETSLAIKFEVVQKALEMEMEVEVDVDTVVAKGKRGGSARSSRAAAAIFVTNPALLATTNAILEARVERYRREGRSLEEAMRPRAGRGKGTLSKIGVGSASTTIVLEKVKRKETKRKEIGRRQSVVGGDGNVGERVLTYADTDEVVTVPPEQMAHFKARIGSPFTKVVEPLQLFQRSSSSSTISVTAFASGAMFPTDDIYAARGLRRAGGFAVHFPQIAAEPKEDEDGSNSLAERFRLAARMSFGMIVPEEEQREGKDGGVSSDFDDGLILVGFPFLRPSRNRVDLYACHGALKVVLQLLKLAASLGTADLGSGDGIGDRDVRIEICTDSSYAWKHLRDGEQVARWGAAPSIDEFAFDGDGPESLANPDLLFPLSKTVNNLRSGEVMDRLGRKLKIGRSVTVTFQHSAEVLSDTIPGGYIARLNSFAKKAAKWQFDKG